MKIRNSIISHVDERVVRRGTLLSAPCGRVYCPVLALRGTLTIPRTPAVNHSDALIYGCNHSYFFFITRASEKSNSSGQITDDSDQFRSLVS